MSPNIVSIYVSISLHDYYHLENNGPKSCYLSVKFECRIDKYRVDERITMMMALHNFYNFEEKPPTVIL